MKSKEEEVTRTCEASSCELMERLSPIAVCSSRRCFSLFFPRMKVFKDIRRNGSWSSAVAAFAAAAAAAEADGSGKGLENDVFAGVAVVAVVAGVAEGAEVAVVAEDDLVCFRTKKDLGMFDVACVASMKNGNEVNGNAAAGCLLSWIKGRQVERQTDRQTDVEKV